MDTLATSADASKQVFISYSREPTENAQFVRDLAGRLRVAGFSVWLDEEQIPGGATIPTEITKAVQQSEVGMFVVTARWVKRPWTQHEVDLFAQRPDSRRLVLLRENADLKDLGPHLGRLKSLTWAPGDPEPDARFWEIYCGITGTAPGPQQDWGAKGRSIVAGKTAPAPQAAAPEAGKGGEIPLICTGKPVDCVTGENWTFLVTDLDEWVGVGAGGEAHPPIGRLMEHSAAAIDSSQTLLVAMYEPMIARLRGKQWDYLPQKAPILCFGSCPGGDLAGTAGGAVLLLGDGEAELVVRTRDPVMALARCEGGTVVLGSRGILGRIAWPLAGQEFLKWVQPGEFGRPVGLFQTVESRRVGLIGRTRIGDIDPVAEQVTIHPERFEDGVRHVVFFGAQSWPYAVLTDAGRLVLIDAALQRARPVRFPPGATVRGYTGCGARGVPIAWTNEGRLYRVSPDGVAEVIAGNDVVLAYGPGTAGNAVHVVRWRERQGTTVEVFGLS